MTHQGSGGSAPYDAREVANYVLDEAERIGISLTQLQLYKIVYFAHGWYLATEGRHLIKQNFQAWEYGPVVLVLRDAFKSAGKMSILCRAERMDLHTGELIKIQPMSNESDCRFVSKIVHFYSSFDGWALSEITHEPGSPWSAVWNTDKPTGNLGLRISNEMIKEYFERLPRKFVMN
jgi:uncharacterized phage-associated protein